MCFSAPASFTAAALLLPVGGLALKRSLSPMAVCPLLFGLQQAVEGFVWIGVEGGGEAPWLAPVALLYLFFAYGFWPAWIPFAVLRFQAGEGLGWRWILTSVLLGVGLLIGISLWLPLLFEAVPPIPTVVEGSLHYPTPTLFAGRGLDWLGEGLYGVVIGVPLLLSSSSAARLYAVFLLAAFVVTEWFYRPSFSSVWCYCCALLSILVLAIVWGRDSSGGGILSPSPAPPGGRTAE